MTSILNELQIKKKVSLRGTSGRCETSKLFCIENMPGIEMMVFIKGNEHNQKQNVQTFLRKNIFFILKVH